MTHVNESNLMPPLLEMAGKDGTDSLLGAFRLLLNEAMRLERGQVLGAQPYERCEGRQGCASGVKDKTWKAGLREVTLPIPQTGGVPFFPQSRERECRSDKPRKVAMAEMDVMDIPLRSVTAVLQEAFEA